MFQAHVVGQERSGADMLSLFGAESPDAWQRAGVGTVSDFFRLLGRSWVFLLVVCHSRSPCACFKPMWSVRRGQGPTCYHFLELSHKKGLRKAHWRFEATAALREAGVPLRGVARRGGRDDLFERRKPHQQIARGQLSLE